MSPANVINKPISRLLRAYYLGPNHPMKLRFWWTLRRVVGFPRLTMPYAGGGWITVNESDHLQGQIFTHGDYEPEVWETLARFANHNEVFWDVGANIGSVSIKALQDPRVAQVHAIEPDPLHADTLELNLSLNRGRYQIHRVALSDRSEWKIVYHGPSANSGLSTLVEGLLPTGQRFEVECLPLDTLVQERRAPSPTLMKIDVEGWEVRVLHGAAATLADAPPRAIVFEAECDQLANMLDTSLVNFLEHYGYDVRHIPRKGGWIEPRENYLALHRGTDR
jgi:FkbM family methyltransferase